MKKVLLALLGLILLAILSFFCFQDKADTIRETLVSSTTSALNANNIQGIQADLNGDDFKMTDIIRLTGEVSTVAQKAKAESIAKAIEGVGGVDNQLIVAAKKTDTAALLPEPEEGRINPYLLTITKDEEHKLSIKGYVENEGNKTLLLAKAKKLFGSENVTNKLKIATGAPEDWDHISNFALDRLKDVDYGAMKLKNQSYEFTGHLPSPSSKAAFLDGIRTVMSNPENNYGKFRGDYIITAPVEEPVIASKEEPKKEPVVASKKVAPVLVKVPMAETVASCQTKIDGVLDGRKILFDNNKAIIKQNSFALLDNLVIAIKECPITKLDITGHTDNRGSSAYNERLSSYRASSVKRYFVKKGLSKNIMRTIGFGETQPITSNSNDAERAKNRRIEFIVKGVK